MFVDLLLSKHKHNGAAARHFLLVLGAPCQLRCAVRHGRCVLGLILLSPPVSEEPQRRRGAAVSSDARPCQSHLGTHTQNIYLGFPSMASPVIVIVAV